MDINSILETFHKEWPMIKAAPYSFFICVFLASAIFVVIIWAANRGRVAKLKENIEHLKGDKERLKERIEDQSRAPAQATPVSLPSAQPFPPSKLRIISSYYGGINGEADEEVTEKYLRPKICGDALVGWVGADLFGPFQPVINLPKRLIVHYSFSGKEATVTRPENAMLVLPEDQFLKQQIEETSREWDKKFKQCDLALEETKLQIPVAAYGDSPMLLELRKRIIVLATDLFGLLREKGPAPDNPLNHMRVLNEEWSDRTTKWWQGYRLPLNAAYQHKFHLRVKDMIYELTEQNIKNRIADDKVTKEDVDPEDIRKLASDLVETAAGMDVTQLSKGT
jgi:hypothetical protein